ncbi:MAG: ferrochelatase, partial [Chloroflexota bacterium]
MSVRGAQSKDTPKYDDVAKEYDAVLVMSFGGPDKAEDVVPFLENVTRGRGIPKERLEEVGE